jgi:hypothetical protein
MDGIPSTGLKGRRAGWVAVLAPVAGLVVAAPAHAACKPTPTHRVGRFVLIGRGPVQAGSAFGRRAVLTVQRDRRDGRYVGRLFWLINRSGPQQVRLAGEGLDRQGALEVRAATGRAEGDTLILDRTRIARAVQQKPVRWIGAPGELRLPAPGCYRLRAHWPGGGWYVVIRARVGVVPRR